MADYTWPANLPQSPLVDGFEETPPYEIVRTSMDAGPAKVRRRATSGVRRFQVQFIMTTTQMTIFDDFYVSTLSHGASRYDWDDPRTEVSKEWRIVDRPRYSPVGSEYWRVSFSLEQMP